MSCLNLVGQLLATYLATYGFLGLSQLIRPFAEPSTNVSLQQPALATAASDGGGLRGLGCRGRRNTSEVRTGRR